MAEWSTFVAAVVFLLVVLLVLSHISATVLNETMASTESSLSSTAESTEPSPASTDEPVADGQAESVTFDEPAVSSSTDQPATEYDSAGDHPPLSTAALLANVVGTQGVFAVSLIALAWYSQIPAWAFGLAADALSIEAVGLGVLVGVVFYGLNEAAVQVGRQYGMEPPTTLREALAPESFAGWVVLFVVVLPIIAGFEELLFRGALIGVVHAGFEVPLWLLAIGSSVAFGLGHGAQGRLGMLITGALGLGLAVVFILSGNLVVVIVAHYLINALEFVVHERG